MKYIKWFNELSMKDVSVVGGKNASLGQMIHQLSKEGIRIPNGFAITAEAYWYFLKKNNLLDRMKKIMSELTDPNDLVTLKKVGAEIRSLIAESVMPVDLGEEIDDAYKKLCKEYHQENLDVAVRSSATAEDLPEASFAGQQDTFLNIQGIGELLVACKKSMASLFTDRAIIYRIEKGFDHFQVALSVGVQKMVRSDLASAGVAFTLDTESGFKDMVMINAAWGLGEVVVKGMINPDEFRIHKPTLQKGFKPIIKKLLGDKPIKIIYGKDKKNPTEQVTVGNKQYKSFSLSDDEILELAHYCVIIEDHYSKLNNKWMPMDIEWAKDGLDNKLYIIQARPETIHASKFKPNMLLEYRFTGDINADQCAKKLLVSGQSIGQQIATGNARVAENIKELNTFQAGDILITSMTDPDWVPIMKKASAIVTDRGGRTSHAAIVSRELGIPAIVGTERATGMIENGKTITIDCSQGAKGYVYEGSFAFEIVETNLKDIPKVPVELMVNIADPDRAFRASFLPVDGVGLARTEFIISNMIKMHPMAAADPEKITDHDLLRELDELTRGYPDYKTFFVDTLAQGVSSIAAAFYPRPVIVRFSDFKSNEYRNLLAGNYYEPMEENPMLGLRGASRYYSKLYEPAFLLECAALKRARDYMGFTNIKIMIPFVRTITEAERVIGIMRDHGLSQNNGLELYMMCEIPSNVILIDEFCAFFDGISIGSNDLTQLTLGIDRDSELLAPLFDERDPAVKKMMKLAVEGANCNNRYSGICGEAPSDYPEIGKFLIEVGIKSISLNPDSVLSFLQEITTMHGA